MTPGNLRDALRSSGCPSPDGLEAAVEHRAVCASCEAEWAMMRELLEGQPRADERADVRWVAGRIRKVTGEPAVEPWWRAWTRLPAAMAAVLAVMSVGLWMSRQGGPGPVVYDGPGELRSAEIRVVEPVGDVASRPERFRWEAAPGAVRYEVVVEEVDGTEVWRGQSNGAALAAPDALVKLMLPRKTLLWRVEAVDAAGGRKGASQNAKFRWMEAR